mmetsp:Transcript_5061/g.13119  ORF Transcript_5061/g.13119 Transcript_5061/m.13119 type:complete len:234 (-) Transcript_5061:144-845(-)
MSQDICHKVSGKEASPPPPLPGAAALLVHALQPQGLRSAGGLDDAFEDMWPHFRVRVRRAPALDRSAQQALRAIGPQSCSLCHRGRGGRCHRCCRRHRRGEGEGGGYRSERLIAAHRRVILGALLGTLLARRGLGQRLGRCGYGAHCVLSRLDWRLGSARRHDDSGLFCRARGFCCALFYRPLGRRSTPAQHAQHAHPSSSSSPSSSPSRTRTLRLVPHTSSRTAHFSAQPYS